MAFQKLVQIFGRTVTVKQPAQSEILGFMRDFNAAVNPIAFLEDRGTGEAYSKELIGAEFAQAFSRLYVKSEILRDSPAGEAWLALAEELLAFSWAFEEQVAA